MEALLATAFGLAAAIPAVVIYNAFVRAIANYWVLYADAWVEILNLVSREIRASRRVPTMGGCALRCRQARDEAMPGATTARLVVCSFEMPMKLFMMPQTVPNRPTNGAVAPMVAELQDGRSALRKAVTRVRRPSPRLDV
jgi:MotA/TolQ/ExbB proton channel family